MRTPVATLPDEPRTVALTEVIKRLGKVTAGLTATPESAPPERLPDWLVTRPTHQVGLPLEAVARMDLREADAWTAWTSGQR